MLVLVGACSGPSGVPEELRPDVDWEAVVAATDPNQRMSWREDVQPVLERRCVVCHGCYDAPCQLKLSSYEGLIRGANPEKVYDGTRIRAVEPTRLYIDATTLEEWHEKGFHSVIGENHGNGDTDPADRLRESVLYQMLRLKQLNPQPRTGLLPDAMTLSLDREQSCTTEDGMARFRRDKPLWGMPYAMPNLSDAEYQTLVEWLAEGAEGPTALENSPGADRQIVAWETFLNGADNRTRLMGRYIYEHLFLGHLHFDGTSDREFYRLIRSYTPPGEPIREIATARPFDDPGVKKFWYRLRRYESTIVAKSHVVYTLSDAKLERYHELFLEPDYKVGALPGYEYPDTANPFKNFADIPPISRYEFLLDDARFFIQGFIHGPVCRGQVALNAIEDRFWVVFTNPRDVSPEDHEYILNRTADYLQIPSSNDTLRLLEVYTRYWDKQKAYLAAKTSYIAERIDTFREDPLQIIWDGDGTNPNAALTIFRHFDSASVEYGLLGEYPETAWIINYPLLERIHYLLVAAFDVYGNAGHQLNSRLFMDFLRMEGEDNFLTLLPATERKTIRDRWYAGLRAGREDFFEEDIGWLNIDSPVEFQTDDYQRELYRLLEARLGPMAGPVDYLNRCSDPACTSAGQTEQERRTDTVLRQLTEIRGEQLTVFPEVVFIRVLLEGKDDLAYTLIRNKSYHSLYSIFEEGDAEDRDMKSDTLTLMRGLSGNYPNFFFVVPEARLEEFVANAASISNINEYHAFVGRFGVRRTNPEFWTYADWFHSRYAKEKPLEAGIFDLNRYANR
jgi:hypothetical protein